MGPMDDDQLAATVGDAIRMHPQKPELPVVYVNDDSSVDNTIMIVDGDNDSSRNSKIDDDDDYNHDHENDTVNDGDSVNSAAPGPAAVTTTPEITIEIYVPSARSPRLKPSSRSPTDTMQISATSTVNQDSAVVAGAKELMEALRPLLNEKGALINSSKIPKFIAAVHKLKEPLLKVQAISVLQAVNEASLLKDLVKSKIPDLFRVWLTAAIKDNDSAQNGVIVSILKVLLAIPMTLDVLRSSSLGKFINRLKKHESTDINSLSNSIYEKWRVLLSSAPVTESENALIPKEQPTTTPPQQQQKRSVPFNPSPASSNIKKAVDLDIFDMFRPASGAGSDAAQKTVKRQKLDLPKIPKRPLSAAASGPNELSSAESSLINSPSTTSASNSVKDKSSELHASSEALYATDSQQPHGKKKKKSVSWAPDSLLCQVKLFHSENERNSDRRNNKFKSAREMDRNEAGTAIEMLRREMVATADWRPLQPIRLSSNIELPEVNSKEAMLQSDRERSILAAIYVDLRSIPPSAKEPEPVDASPTVMEYEIPRILLDTRSELHPQSHLPQAPVYYPQQSYPFMQSQMHPAIYSHPAPSAHQPQQQQPHFISAPPTQMMGQPQFAMMHNQPLMQMSSVGGMAAPHSMMTAAGVQSPYFGQYPPPYVMQSQQSLPYVMQQQQQSQPIPAALINSYTPPQSTSLPSQKEQYLQLQQQNNQHQKLQKQQQKQPPTLCKFGEKCKRRDSCKFLHTDD